MAKIFQIWLKKKKNHGPKKLYKSQTGYILERKKEWETERERKEGRREKKKEGES